MSDMTAQEVFDTVARHLLTQKKRSEKGSGSSFRCMYRGPNGLKCAVGCLITDDEYIPEMDGSDHASDVHSLYGRGLLPPQLRPHVDMLAELQNIHDTWPIESWYARLAELAKLYELNTDVLKGV